MAYQINKTDGTIISTIADGQIDENSTDLTLIGRNYSGFGEALNENFIKLLENFSSTSAPNKAIRGQLWFDSSENKVKVYNGLQFVPVSSATVSSTQPSTLSLGDLWYNDISKQLFFFDGSQAVLMAPLYSEIQGLSGLRVESILDIENQTRVITTLYNNGILIGIFAKDKFTPKIPIVGFSENDQGTVIQKDILPGFNRGTHKVRIVNPLTNAVEEIPLTFRVTVENSENLGGRPDTDYVRTDTSGSINGQLRLTSDLGLVVGSGGQGSLIVDSLGNVLLANQASGRDLQLSVRRGETQETAVRIISTTRQINFYTSFGAADSSVNIGGSLTVIGDLTVQGLTTTINTQNLTIEDKAIELARQTGITPTDANADGGGIILRGSEPHVILWSDAGQPENVSEGIPALLSRAWTSSEHFNLRQNKYYAIDGVPLIEQTSTTPGNKTFRLTSFVTSIEGVSSFGKQNVINVGPGALLDPAYMRFQDNRISTLGGSGQPADLDLELDPAGSGNIVLIGTPRITGLQGPIDINDAANKDYVDTTIESRPIIFNIDLTDGKSNEYIRVNILNNVAPPGNYRSGTEAKILCNILTNSTTALTLPAPSLSTAIFNTPTGTAPAVTNVSIPTATVPAAPISVTRVIKTFRISAGVWQYVAVPGDVTLPA
jgi:hypothetical protein